MQLKLKKFLYLSLSLMTLAGFAVAADSDDVSTNLSGIELINSIPADNFQSIVGGTITPFGSTQFAVALFRRFSANRSSYLCSASLVSPTHVVTAGHCVVNEILNQPLAASQLFVRVGTNRIDDDSGTDIDLVSSTPHPDFDLDGFQNDIALLELEEPVDIEPIVIPTLSSSATRFPGAGDQSTVSGWGETFEQSGASDVLRQVDLPVVSHLRCLPVFQQSLKNDTKFCAGGLREGGVDACAGDSGGPLTVMRQGREVLAGITSSGRGCALPGIPAVYTRVSEFAEWLTTTSDGEIIPEPFDSLADNDELSAAVTIADSTPITSSAYRGQIEVYQLEESRTVTLTSLSGDSDLFIYDEDSLIAGQPVCVSENIGSLDECTIDGTDSMLTAVVYGFLDSTYTIEATGAPVREQPVEQPFNDDSPVIDAEDDSENTSDTDTDTDTDADADAENPINEDIDTQSEPTQEEEAEVIPVAPVEEPAAPVEEPVDLPSPPTDQPEPPEEIVAEDSNPNQEDVAADQPDTVVLPLPVDSDPPSETDPIVPDTISSEETDPVPPATQPVGDDSVSEESATEDTIEIVTTPPNPVTAEADPDADASDSDSVETPVIVVEENIPTGGSAEPDITISPTIEEPTITPVETEPTTSPTTEPVDDFSDTGISDNTVATNDESVAVESSSAGGGAGSSGLLMLLLLAGCRSYRNISRKIVKA